MRGLLVKDLCLLGTQKRFFVLVLAMGALLTFAGQDITFVMGYMTMVLVLFAGSTISYDEMNHGMEFLLTLPVNRKQYVQGKYLFMIILTAVSLAVSSLYGLAADIIGNVTVNFAEMVENGIFIAVMLMAFTSIFLMLILKYGAEKARIVVAIIFGVGIFIGWLSKIIGEKADGKLLINLNIGNWSNEAVILCCCGVSVLVMLVTYAVSVRIMAKRDF